jgi:hypothetical protein
MVAIPQYDRKIFLATTKAGKSINAWMEEVLADTADHSIHACQCMNTVTAVRVAIPNGTETVPLCILLADL